MLEVRRRIEAPPAVGDDARPARRPQPALRPNDGQTALDVAHDYAAAGLLPEAIEVLEAVAGPDGPDDQGDPLVAYTLGWLFARSGDPDAAMAWYERGRRLPPDGCFPARLEEIEDPRGRAGDEPC